ncbi:radical SAM protein [Clostridioides difficile]|nr:radical SAM protein [Clostridioides difficile]
MLNVKDSSNMYKYTDNLRITQKDNLVILASEESREWIRISQECFDILNKVLKMNLSHNDILDCFELDKDRLYFDNLIKCLCSSRILINKKYNLTREIESVYFIITERCNLSCKHCCSDSTTSTLEDELSTEDMISIIDKILQINPKNITISGGEPLVRSDIWIIIDYLRSRFDGNLDIMTNGLLINENNINYIKQYFDSISISIDGIDEESCKIIRGNNIFKNVIEKVKFLKMNDFNNISLSAVLPNNENINIEFETLNKHLGTEPMIRHFSYQGRAGLNYEQISKSMNEYLKSRGMEEKNIIDWNSYIPTNKREVRIGACGGCETTISIGSNGELYPCNLLMNSNYSIGNILKIEDIVSFINNMSVSTNAGYNEFVNLKLCNNNDKCKKCLVKPFCWSCPAEYDDLLSKDYIFEDRCEKIKETLISVVWG